MKFQDLLNEVRNLDDEKYYEFINILTEENRIFAYEQNYIFWIFREPLGNPSFHIVNKTKNIDSVFSLKDFSLLERHSRKQYSNKEIKKIKEWLNETTENSIKRKYLLVDTWNNLNPKYKINIEYIKW